VSTGQYILIALVSHHSGCVTAADNWMTGMGTYWLSHITSGPQMVSGHLWIDWLEQEQSTHHEKMSRIH